MSCGDIKFKQVSSAVPLCTAHSDLYRQYFELIEPSRSNLNNIHLEESGLAAFSDRVDAELVEASWGGDGGVVVDPLPAVDGPVVVAVVVHSAVPVKHQSVLTNLLVQGA